MIVKRLLLLGLGSVLSLGCQPSRSVDAHLPRSPQLARVQTPVLHPTPAPGQSIISESWHESSPLPTYGSEPLSWTSSTLQQSDGLAEDQEFISLMPMLPSLSVREQNVPGREQENILPVAEVGDPDHFQQNSSWIKPIQTVDVDSLDQLRSISQEEPLSQPYTLELLDVDTLEKPSQVIEPTRDATVPNSGESSAVLASELTFVPTVANTLSLASVPLPIRQPVKTMSQMSVPVAQDIVESEDVGVVVMPRSQTFTTPDQMMITTGEKVSEIHQDTGELLAESVTLEVVSSRPDSYVIQKGDTLWSIATRFYGQGQRWKDIARKNNIRRPDRMVVGMRLQLP